LPDNSAESQKAHNTKVQCSKEITEMHIQHEKRARIEEHRNKSSDNEKEDKEKKARSEGKSETNKKARKN
jgi:hypothetical protein